MIRLLTGDCRDLMVSEGPFDLIVADPPYGDTALAWDVVVEGWEAVARARLKPTGSMWVFGSMRSFMALGVPSGWRMAQDLVWEKHNGSGFAVDRFRRVHEHIVQFYRDDAPWSAVYRSIPRVPRVGPDKTGARRGQPAHTGQIKSKPYVDDGTRLARSVIKAPSVRGGPHGTAKPPALLEMLVRASCPPGGLVGDFFAGSGSVGHACAALGCAYVGCELDPEMAGSSRDRLVAA